MERFRLAHLLPNNKASSLKILILLPLSVVKTSKSYKSEGNANVRRSVRSFTRKTR